MRVAFAGTIDILVDLANPNALRRPGCAEETADVVAYLASGGASFITGTNVDLNGGLLFS